MESNRREISIGERVREMADQKQRRKGKQYIRLPEGVDFWKPEKGSQTIDVLPYIVNFDGHKWVTKGNIWFEYSYLLHNNIGVDKYAYVCPRTIGKKCPVCDHRDMLRKEGTDTETIEALKPKERQLFNIRHNSQKIQVWDVSHFLFGKKLEEEIVNQPPKIAEFFTLDKGYSLLLRFIEKMFANKEYLEVSKIDFIERELLSKDIMKNVVDLSKTLNILPYEELKKIFLGVEEDVTIEEIPEEEPIFESVHPEEEPVVHTHRATPQEANPCPCGYNFGIDTDKKPECNECGDEWQQCTEKKLKLAKETRIKK